MAKQETYLQHIKDKSLTFFTYKEHLQTNKEFSIEKPAKGWIKKICYSTFNVLRRPYTRAIL